MRGGGPSKTSVALKKLNWRVQPLNDVFIKRAGGAAIWRNLPKVEIPRELYSELFAQKPSLLNQAVGAQPVSTRTIDHYIITVKFSSLCI